jgi:hypothetical protein
MTYTNATYPQTSGTMVMETMDSSDAFGVGG